MTDNIVTPPAPQTAPPPTLADLTVSWTIGQFRITVTGRELAYLLLAATASYKHGGCPPIIGDVGVWIGRLQGMSALVFPDAGIPIHAEEGRALLDDVLQWAAAHLYAADSDLEHFARQCAVATAPGAGLGKPERIDYLPDIRRAVVAP